MLRRLFLLSCGVFALLGCQTTPSTTATLTPKSLYATTTAQLPAAAQLPPYAQLYQSFLADGGALQQSMQWRSLHQQIQQTDIAQCHTVDWQQALSSQLFNLSFYRYALACFRQQKDQTQLARFSAYRSYVQQGILASGDGKHAYSAFQINNFADAAELVALADLQIQDYQVELASHGNALYYSLHLYDPANQQFMQWYFDNQRFLHAIDQVPYPFIGLFDGWQKQMIPQSASANSPMMTLLGYVQQQEQRYADAEQTYLKAIAAGSLEAAVLLDQLAHKHTTVTSRAQSLAYVVDAADHDYLPALYWLLYQRYVKYQGAQPDAEIQPMLDYIGKMAPPGEAELTLARYFLNGQFDKAQPELGIKWMQKAGAQGDKSAAAYAIVAQKELHLLDEKAAATEFKKIADQGGSEAAYLYASALMQQQQLTTADKQQAHRYLLQAEKAWHPEAFYLLAYGYEAGWFDSQGRDAKQLAWHYYVESAERFYPRAMLRLGNAYREGDLTAIDASRANQWFLLCSRQGHVGCAYNAAVMLDDGEGVNKDRATAFRLFEFAAEQGYAPALNRLALMYVFGQGTDANINKGVQLLQQAANQGSVSAYYYLGVLYFEGKLVAQDFAKAKAYLQQAKQHPKAAQMLQHWDELTKKSAKQQPTATN